MLRAEKYKFPKISQGLHVIHSIWNIANLFVDLSYLNIITVSMKYFRTISNCPRLKLFSCWQSPFIKIRLVTFVWPCDNIGHLFPFTKGDIKMVKSSVPTVANIYIDSIEVCVDNKTKISFWHNNFWDKIHSAVH